MKTDSATFIYIGIYSESPETHYIGHTIKKFNLSGSFWVNNSSTIFFYLHLCWCVIEFSQKIHCCVPSTPLSIILNKSEKNNKSPLPTPLYTRTDQYIDSSSEYNIAWLQWTMSLCFNMLVRVVKTTWIAGEVKGNMVRFVDDFLERYILFV